jgi:hypothetical protein
MAVLTGWAFVRFGSYGWLLVCFLGAMSSIVWFVRARSAGDTEAPPPENPALVWRLTGSFAAAALGILIGLLLRIQGDWERLREPTNFWLGMLCAMAIAAAIYSPLELTRGKPTK